MIGPVDLRSDTVTKPTPAMREAMAGAEVGDDVFGDDPTVKALETETAALLGKEAALFTPSGTMANQLAIRGHTEPGDEIIVESEAHIYYYESGGPAMLSGVMPRCVPGSRGVFSPASVEAALRPPDQHFPPTRLVCIENTHNRGCGKVWSVEEVAAVSRVARKHALAVHMDGARLWNACVAAGVPERDYAAHCDTVSVCYSKGLGAPVGSALVGSKDFITKVRRFRKMFGGGMRQAGIIAAGALHALRHHRARLAEDHANARALAEGLSRLRGLEIDCSTIETNMVKFRVTRMSNQEFAKRMTEEGILVLDVGGMIRAVTNLMVSADDINRAIGVASRVLG